MTHIFDKPFASEGDRSDIPTSKDPNGNLSIPEGFGYDFERNLKTDDKAKKIDRSKFNSILYLITQALGEVQRKGASVWNEKMIPYEKGVMVYLDSALWLSTVGPNNSKPGVNKDWLNIASNLEDTSSITSEDVEKMLKVFYQTHLLCERELIICKGVGDLQNTIKHYNLISILQHSGGHFVGPSLLEQGTGTWLTTKDGKGINHTVVTPVANKRSYLMSDVIIKPDNFGFLFKDTKTAKDKKGIIIGTIPVDTGLGVLVAVRSLDGTLGIEFHEPKSGAMIETVLSSYPVFKAVTSWDLAKNGIKLSVKFTDTHVVVLSNEFDDINAMKTWEVPLTSFSGYTNWETALYSNTIGIINTHSEVSDCTFYPDVYETGELFLETNSDYIYDPVKKTFVKNTYIELSLGVLYTNFYLGSVYYNDPYDGMTMISRNNRTGINGVPSGGMIVDSEHIKVTDEGNNVKLKIVQPFPGTFVAESDLGYEK